MEKDSQNKNFLDTLRENWFIIVFLGSILIGWTNIGSRLNILENNQGELKQSQKDQAMKIDEGDKNSTQLAGAIIEIKANYIYIKEKLDKIK